MENMEDKSKNTTEEKKTSVVEKSNRFKAFVTFKTLLMYIAAVALFGFITLYLTTSGLKRDNQLLANNDKVLEKNDKAQQDSIDAVAVRLRDLEDSFSLRKTEDSLKFIGIGNDLVRHDEEIKKLQKRGNGSGYYVLVQENKDLKSRVSVLEQDLSSHLIVKNQTTNSPVVQNNTSGDDDDEESDEDEDENEDE